MDRPSDRPRVVFFAQTGDQRGVLAEALARAVDRERRFAVFAAAPEASPPAESLRSMLAAHAIAIPDWRLRTLEEITLDRFDAVVALSKEAAEACPILPGNPARVNWRLEPVAADACESALQAAFEETRRLVHDLFERGYLETLTQSGRNADLIADNVPSGIIAHDFRRRIFHFSRAAEKITGFRRLEVLGHDCHDVFNGGLCGALCRFPDDRPPDLTEDQRKVRIATRSGETRTLETHAKVMTDAEDRPVGILVAFDDATRRLDLERRLGEIEQFSGIVGRDERMLEIFDLIQDVADSDVPALITGESGTGKELVAAAIHREGARANKLFVPVNCAALPEGLLESELFGHVRGAFTGAVRDKKGRFELAENGTIFLDEIGDLSPALQVKLLRVLQEGTFERVGGEKTIHADVRVVSATNRDLSKEIAEGRFREDLFYRLAVVPIHLPPLRERRADIPLLANHLLERIFKQTGRRPVALSQEALDLMLQHEWPGNVRELQNWLQFALVKCKGDVLEARHLPPAAGWRDPDRARRGGRRRKLDAPSVERALERTGGNKLQAAKRLGVSRATLYRFLDAREREAD